MNELIIIIEGGSVQSVFSTEDNSDVEIIDLDTQDSKKLDELDERLKEIEEAKKEGLLHELW